MSQNFNAHKDSRQNLDKKIVSTFSVKIKGGFSVEQSNELYDTLLAHEHIIECITELDEDNVTIKYDLRYLNSRHISQMIMNMGLNIDDSDVFNTHIDTDTAPSLPSFFIPYKNIIISVMIALIFIVQDVGVIFDKPVNWFIGIDSQFFLASMVQFILALPIYKKFCRYALKDLNRTDVLLIIATQVVWTYSTFVYFSLLGWVTPSEELLLVYYDVSVVLLALFMVGQLIQFKLSHQDLYSHSLLDKYLPKTVELLNKSNHVTNQGMYQNFDETPQIIGVEELKVADFVQVKEGDRVAGDGMVRQGLGWVDESHLTGNSTLIRKKRGDVVLSGSLLVNGSFNYALGRLGKKSQLGNLLFNMQKVQETKNSYGHVVRILLFSFIPLVIIIGLSTFIGFLHNTYIDTSLLKAVAVLLVACPSLFWLSSKLPIIVATGVASTKGIWFKDIESLHELVKIDTIVMNKTATLSQGTFKVASHYFFDDSISLTDVLQLAASVETHCRHPIATAICGEAKKQSLSLLTVKHHKVHVGKGVEAMVEGMGVVRVGSPTWLNVELPAYIRKNIPKIFPGASLIAVSINEIPLGFLVLMDDLKKDRKDEIIALKNTKFDVILLSGDEGVTVAKTAEKMAIEEYYYSLAPKDKVKKIGELQEQGHRVAMVSAGTNDRGVMNYADLAFDMSTKLVTKNYDKNSKMKQTSSIKIMNQSFESIIHARDIAQNTLKTIKHNLLFSTIYNILAVALALLGVLNPISAVVLMSAVPLVIVWNVQRLKSNLNS